MRLFSSALAFGARSSLLGVLALTCSASVLAADGYLDINQACAQVGCFPGDNPATLTVEITGAAGARSFRLTSDLRITELSGPSSMITVDGSSVDNITIDLQGHTIGCFAGSDSSCRTGFGISLANSGRRAEVRNGVIFSFGDGIRSEGTLIVDGVRFDSQSDDGVQLLRGIVRNSTFVDNRYGINGVSGTGDNVLIENNLFIDTRSTPSQDPVFGISSDDACSGNLLGDSNAAGTLNLGSCSELGPNLCGTARCGFGGTQQAALQASESKAGDDWPAAKHTPHQPE